MNFDRITPAAIAASAAPSRIEEIAARIRGLKADYGKLEEASARLNRLSENIGVSENIYLEQGMRAIDREVMALEESITIERPQN